MYKQLQLYKYHQLLMYGTSTLTDIPNYSYGFLLNRKGVGVILTALVLPLTVRVNRALYPMIS